MLTKLILKPMPVLLFFVLLIVSFSSFAKQPANQQDITDFINELSTINAKLLVNDDEDVINHLLKKKNDVLGQLMNQLKLAKTSQLAAVTFAKEMAFLQSRIEVNTERKNYLAAQRDQLKLEANYTKEATRKYLKYLIESSKNYHKASLIIKESQVLLDQSLAARSKIVLLDSDVSNAVSEALIKNYHALLQVNDSYEDILLYVITDPLKIASVHWFQEFSLSSAILYINHFDFMQPINYKLAPFKIDAGGVFLSLVIFFLVYFSYPFVFKCTKWCVETYIIDKEVEQQELIYLEVRKPARTLLVFWGLDLGAYAFFYKNDYRPSLEGFSFIIYSVLFIWLLFKIIDSIVLLQVQKLSNSNKELRKELFNLGVQAGKAFIVIAVLAFGLNHFGISLTAIMSTLGVGGLAFALAAKDTLSNLFGGMTILFDNVFRMGDWVKVGDVEGTVAEIGLRSTTIRTFDNALITIPNSLVSISSVMNWNRRAVGRRIKLHVGVTYESNMDDLRQGIADIREMLKNHPDIANPKQKIGSNRNRFRLSSHEDTQGIKSTQLVFLDKYNDFSIDILIYCFARTVKWNEWLKVKEDILFKIADILKQNNLEFAYPTQVRIHRNENESIFQQGVPTEDVTEAS